MTTNLTKIDLVTATRERAWGYAYPRALTAADVAFLQRIFKRASLDDDTEMDRDVRATELVRLYQDGIVSETELLARLDRNVSPDP